MSASTDTTVLVTGATGAVGPGAWKEIFDLGFMIADLKNRESGQSKDQRSET